MTRHQKPGGTPRRHKGGRVPHGSVAWPEWHDCTPYVKTAGQRVTWVEDDRLEGLLESVAWDVDHWVATVAWDTDDGEPMAERELVRHALSSLLPIPLAP